MSRIRIVLVDDHTLVREGISTLLGLVEDLELVGEAASGQAAVQVVADTRPDVLLLDMRMPDGDGLFVVEQLARRGELPA
ncbi:MAG TPA: response regulator transcription factor, partial [Kofleriaceae bacterium]